MHLSHEHVALGKEVYEFCELFSHSSEDIADAADFFMKNLKGFSKDSKQNLFGYLRIKSEVSAGYFSIIVYQIPTDFLHLRIQSQERGRNIVIFIGIWKWLKKYKVSDQSSWSLWVLANSARDVKEICDSSQSVLRVLTKVVSFPYNQCKETKFYARKETFI